MLAVGFVEEEFNKLRELLVELDAEMIKVGRRNQIHKFLEAFNKLRELLVEPPNPQGGPAPELRFESLLEEQFRSSAAELLLGLAAESI